MNELVEILRIIHYDLIAIDLILLIFVVCKNCRGYGNYDIVTELKNIKTAIQSKSFHKE